MKNCLARRAGGEPPNWPDEEKSFDELRGRIRETMAYARLRQGGVELGKLD